MTLSDALREMELVGHDFFLFVDRDAAAERGLSPAGLELRRHSPRRRGYGGRLPLRLSRPAPAGSRSRGAGFARARPAAAPTVRDIQRVIDTVGVVQIDSVNVVCRSQYLPFFSRLGPFDAALRPCA